MPGFNCMNDGNSGSGKNASENSFLSMPFFKIAFSNFLCVMILGLYEHFDLKDSFLFTFPNFVHLSK